MLRTIRRSFALAACLSLSACATTTGFQSGAPGRAYIVDSHNYLVTSDNVVWSCDATTGSPQCWRVVERE